MIVPPKHASLRSVSGSERVRWCVSPLHFRVRPELRSQFADVPAFKPVQVRVMSSPALVLHLQLRIPRVCSPVHASLV